MTWWRYQMDIFSALLAFCVGNSPVIGKFPSQRPVTRSFEVFFDLRLNKQLSKQSWSWWFETQSRSLWRHYNDRHKFNFPFNSQLMIRWLIRYWNCPLSPLQLNMRVAIDLWKGNVDELLQERRSSSALPMELCLSCTNPSMCCDF